MLHNILISFRPMFALMFLALLVYTRMLYVKRQRERDGLPEVRLRMFVKQKKN